MEFHPGAVHRIPEVFSRLEPYDPAGADERFPARLRVAPHAGVLIPHPEGTEPPQRDGLAPRKGFPDGVEDGIDGFFGLDLAEARIVGHEVDDIDLPQRTAPAPRPGKISGMNNSNNTLN